MARPRTRTQPCDRNDALNRLAQAESFLLAAELIVDDDSVDATPSIAASLAVLAGIAASDAACCARLGIRARGQSHVDAVEQLATIEPRGADMAKDLQRLLNRKDDSQYGLAFVSTGDAGRMVRWAKRLVAPRSARGRDVAKAAEAAARSTCHDRAVEQARPRPADVLEHSAKTPLEHRYGVVSSDTRDDQKYPMTWASVL